MLKTLYDLPMSAKGKEKIQDEVIFEDMNIAKDGICLVMIVRDETHVIERALKSVVNVISSYLICDTGSLDGTPEMITKFMDSHGVPGQVIYKEWQNFGYNKSYLLERAYTDGLSLGAKYLIWLDADEVLRSGTTEVLTVENGKKLIEFADNNPAAGIFMFMTYYGSLEYQRWQMVRNNQLFKWICPVHEYLHNTEPTGTISVDFITLLARKEGARTKAGDSSQRDIKMFEDYLEDHPNCSRSTFYLAQTLGEDGQYEKAIEMCTKRLSMGGFYQEKYIAAMRIGHYYIKLEQPKKAFKVWGENWGISPNRVEIPYYYMMALKKLGREKEAYTVGAQAYHLFKKNTKDMFIQKELYNWRFLLEFSVIAFYSGHREVAHSAGKKLIDGGMYPDVQAVVIERNLRFYRKHVNITRDVPLTLSRQFNTHPPAVIIIDDFYINPDEVRKFALGQEFTVTGNYPSRRTEPFATLDHKEAFERILTTKISYWPKQYNGCFQHTTDNHKSWIHRDLTDYSAMVYLTPDPPADGGTLVYRHKATGKSRKSEATEEELKQMNDDSGDATKWDVMDVVGNKYNRLIIFTGRRSHKSNKYFGTDKASGRLFQVFFFDVDNFH